MAHGQPKRPPNCWMLFRADVVEEYRQRQMTLPPQPELSRIASRMWRELDPAKRAQYEARADAAKQAHSQMYPDYQYQPMKKEEKERLKQEEKAAKMTSQGRGMLSTSPNAVAGPSHPQSTAPNLVPLVDTTSHNASPADVESASRSSQAPTGGENQRFYHHSQIQPSARNSPQISRVDANMPIQSGFNPHYLAFNTSSNSRLLNPEIFTFQRPMLPNAQSAPGTWPLSHPTSVEASPVRSRYYATESSLQNYSPAPSDSHLTTQRLIGTQESGNSQGYNFPGLNELNFPPQMLQAPPPPDVPLDVQYSIDFSTFSTSEWGALLEDEE
ncbi:hypothetical protein PM082_019596 [Marasmius tenuissimus]|nr:hypothetical protein PM082_019596 [Marasmius tenuissimus]